MENGYSRGTPRSLELEHSGTQGTWALEALGYLGTQSPEALGHSKGAETLRHSVTWRLGTREAFYLAGSSGGRFCMTIINSAWLRKTQFDAVGMILSYDI